MHRDPETLDIMEGIVRRVAHGALLDVEKKLGVSIKVRDDKK